MRNPQGRIANFINLVKEKTNQYGVDITWNENRKVENDRGVTIKEETDIVKSAKVLLLKEKFNPTQVINTGAIGLSQDYSRYIITLPEIEIEKDLVIIDNHNRKWKLGFIDYYDIGGIVICKQASLTEVA
jgi:hypothetical protein